MKILVCGGAGYIGSHMVKRLVSEGYEVVVLDNLSSGHRQAVQWGSLVEADIRNPDQLSEIFSSQQFDAVMHFSAKSLVGESVSKPDEYYQNNFIGTFNLLEAMRVAGVKNFIFSSTAAVYGTPLVDSIDEQQPTAPINPYGHTKLAVEYLLKDYAKAFDIQSVTLRYFNAAGASTEAEIGEAHDPETHLIPNVLKSMLSGANANLKVFGNDYPTVDGTCVRDYIHVEDLAEAHLKALQHLQNKPGAEVFNLGNGNGFSVLEVIQSAERVVGRSIPYEVHPRRAGDPPVLVANSDKAQKILGWKPQFTEMDDIVRSAWNWHQTATF